MEQVAEQVETPLEKKKRDLQFDVGRSIRYHLWRVQWYERLHTTKTAVTLIAGSSAFAGFYANSPTVTPVSAMLVAVMASLDLAIGTDHMARTHSDLSKNFIRLEKRILLTEPYTEEAHRTFWAERLEIETEEPPTLRMLNRMCHNAELRARGYEEWELLPGPNNWQRLWVHIFSMTPPPPLDKADSAGVLK